MRNLIKRIILPCAALFFGVLLLSNAALAKDAIVERAFLEDPSNLLGFDDVQSKNFTPYQNPLQRGYSASAFWIRLTIAPQAEPVFGNMLVIRILPSYLDEIALYDPLDNGERVPVVGDRHPSMAQAYRSLNHNFVIPARGQPRTVWLRLKTSSTSLMYVDVAPLDEAIAKDNVEGAFLGILVGVLGVFTALATIHWLSYRRKIVAILSVNQCAFLLYLLAYGGYLRLFCADRVPAGWLDIVTDVLIVNLTASVMWFHLNFLREFKPLKLCLTAVSLTICCYPLELILIAADEPRHAMHINAIVNVIGPIAMLIAARTCRVWADPAGGAAPLFSRRGLTLFYVVILGLAIMSSMASLGLVGSWEGTLLGFPLAGLTSGTILLATMRVWERNLHRLHQEAQVGLLVSQQEVDHERQQRQTQGQFMTMLTHELKTSLSVVRMALGDSVPSPTLTARADHAVGDMVAVIERCAWADRLEDFTTEPVALDAIDLIARLCQQCGAPTRIALSVGDDRHSVQSDAQLLTVIVANLLDNAVKYAADGSSIAVDVQAAGHAAGLCVTVANLPGSAGWPDPARVFEKYYRAPGAHRKTGSGLGLYLVAAMVKRIGAEIRYAPSDSHVRFELCLPF